MDYKELATKVRAKHPGAYDDMDDTALAKAVVAKYPVYSDVTFEDQPQEPTPEPKKNGFLGLAVDAGKRALSTFFPQAATLAEKTTEAVTDPIGTLKQAPGAAATAATALIPGGPVAKVGLAMFGGGAGKAYEMAGREVLGDETPTTPTIPFTNRPLPSIPGLPKPVSDVAVEGAVQGALEVPGMAVDLAKNAAPGMARRALGFQKSQLTSTKSWKESLRKMANANRSAAEMLERDVIPFTGSPTEMAKRATKVMDEAGGAMNSVIKQADDAGLTVSPDDVGARLIDELKPEFPNQNKIVDDLLADLEVYRKNPSIQKARELKTRWATTGFQDRTVGTDASKIYRKASGILDDIIGDTISSVDPEMGQSLREAQSLYGKAYTAMGGVSNKLGMEQGNMLMSLPSAVIAAGQLATGDVKGAAMTAGIFEALKRRGAAATANTLFKAGGMGKETPGAVLRTLENRNKQSNNEARPTKTFSEIFGPKKVYADTINRSRLPSYDTPEALRKAALTAKPGQKALFGDTIVQFREPGRKRGKGAPLAIEFLESK